MNRKWKFTGFVLASALLLGSTGTFLVGCKDYDDDISHLQQQIDANKKAIEGIEAQIKAGAILTKVESDGAGGVKVTLSNGQTYHIEKGAKGEDGAQGIQGPEGPQGPMGPKGDAPTFTINEEGHLVASWSDGTSNDLGKVTPELPEVEFTINADGHLIYNGKDLGSIKGEQGEQGEQGHSPNVSFERREDHLFVTVDGKETDLGKIKGEPGATPELPDFRFSIDPASGDLTVSDGMTTTNLGQVVGSISLENGVFYYTTSKGKTEIGKVSFKDVNLNVQNDYLYIGETKVEPAIRMNQNIYIQEKEGYVVINLPGKDTDEYRQVIIPTQSIFSQRLTSIAFVPQYYYNGVPAIMFRTLAYHELEEDENAEVKIEEVDAVGGYDINLNINRYEFFTSALATAKYRLNPQSVGMDCADFSFVGDKADYIFTRGGGADAPISIVGKPVDKNGVAVFTVKKNKKLNPGQEVDPNKDLDIVALKAVLKKGLTEEEMTSGAKPEVYSEYAHVNETCFTPAEVFISDSMMLLKNNQMHHYARTFDKATMEAPRYRVPFDKPFNLREKIATCLLNQQGHEQLDLAAYDLRYAFAKASTPYMVSNGGATQTDQQTVIECTDAEKGIFSIVGNNRESIGRTPIVRVDLVHNGKTVVRAFIKLEIVAEKETDIVLNKKAETITLSCPDDVVNMEFSEEEIRNGVYRIIQEGGMSHEEFWNTYEFLSATTTPMGITVPTLESGNSTDGQLTKKVCWKFTHREIGSLPVNSPKTLTAQLVLKNKVSTSSCPEKVIFTFEISVKRPALTLTVTENEQYWNTQKSAYNVNVAIPQNAHDVAENCIFDNAMGRQIWVNAPVLEGWDDCIFKSDEWNYRITAVIYNGERTTSFTGVQLTGARENARIILDKSDNRVKTALNSLNGLQAEIEMYTEAYNGDVYSLKNFLVNFIRPVNFNLPAGLSVKDARDDGDIVNFQYNGLLTDWRNELIIQEGEENIPYSQYDWVKDCGEIHGEWIPAYQKVVTPAMWEFETEEVTIQTGQLLYSATIKLLTRPNVFSNNWSVYKSFTAKGRSAAEAQQNAMALAKAKEHDEDFYDGWDGTKAYRYTDTQEMTASSEVTFTTVTGITYTPATYETVEAEWKPTLCNEKPAYDPSVVHQVGDKDGCWTWKEIKAFDIVQTGQYWNFYGPFGDVKLDLGNVKTNLQYNNYQLPVSVTLEQIGNTVKYVNVGSPIKDEYMIMIPATISYGWGILSGTLTITVKPV